MLRGTNLRPSNFTMPPSAGFLTGPEKGTTTLVKSFDHPNGKQANAHGMGEKRGEDRVYQDEPPANRKRATSPAREAHVTFRDERGKVGEAKFVSRERKPKVSLRKGRNRTPKGRRHRGSHQRVGMDRNKGTLVEVDIKTSGSRKIVQKGF
jgi:hypothetical protein